jgi:hypothetical protein
VQNLGKLDRTLRDLGSSNRDTSEDAEDFNTCFASTSAALPTQGLASTRETLPDYPANLPRLQAGSARLLRTSS